MEIKSLSGIDFETIVEGFGEAFADYELQLTAAQLHTMLTRRGFNPELSFAAFEGEKIVSFTLNGIGNFNGTATAYDTGTGTLKSFRGQGLATRIFEHSIPILRRAGVGRYLLEVLQHNTAAVSVYRNLGFEVSREFNYFGGQNESSSPKRASYPVCAIQFADCRGCSAFWDFLPSWQNSFEAIERAAADFLYLGVFIERQLVGYGIFEPISGDVTQIAVAPAHRKKGIGSSLLQEMTKQNRNNSIKIINTDTTCTAITDFLKAGHLELRGKQFEMIKKI